MTTTLMQPSEAPKRGRGRPAGVFPTTPEFLALASVLRGKQSAVVFMEAHQGKPFQELLQLAKATVKERQEVRKAQPWVQMRDSDGENVPNTLADNLVSVKTWQDYVVYLRELAKFGIPSDLKSAMEKGPRTTIEYPSHKGVIVRVTLRALEWSDPSNPHHEPVPMMYGIRDRKVIDAIQTVALRKHSRVVFVNEIRRFLRELDGSKGGTLEKESVFAALNRIAATSITLEFLGTSINSRSFDRPRPLISRGNLPIDADKVYYPEDGPTSPLPYGDDEELRPSTNYYVELDEVYYRALGGFDPKYETEAGLSQRRNSLGSTPVWFLRKFASRSPKRYDFAKFIWQRAHECYDSGGTLVSLSAIHAQLGKPDENNYARWAAERLAQLDEIREVWDECPVARIDSAQGVMLRFMPVPSRVERIARQKTPTVDLSPGDF